MTGGKRFMNITNFKIIQWKVPGDTFILLCLNTDTNITGWGEITGSGNDANTIAFAEKAARSLINFNPLEIDSCMLGYEFLTGLLHSEQRCITTAWSGINQALWDISAKASSLPLHRLLIADANTKVSLYANLNRGLFNDRSADAFASNAEGAIEAGFSFAKATPFDEVGPVCTDIGVLASAMDRLQAIYTAVGTERIAIDCHWRFNTRLAREFMAMQAELGSLYWVEDLLDVSLPAETIGLFREEFPDTKWAGGEDLIDPETGERLLNGPARPDVFMPDIKHICGINVIFDLFLSARKHGCALSAHNPSGPVSTAFSAHVCGAVKAEEPLEFCFGAVESRTTLTIPNEPVERGIYHLTDEPGIGIIPSPASLEEFGVLLAEGRI